MSGYRSTSQVNASAVAAVPTQQQDHIRIPAAIDGMIARLQSGGEYVLANILNRFPAYSLAITQAAMEILGLAAVRRAISTAAAQGQTPIESNDQDASKQKRGPVSPNVASTRDPRELIQEIATLLVDIGGSATEADQALIVSELERFPLSALQLLHQADPFHRR